MVEAERRAHERVSLARPCKLYVPKAAKYLPATTCNLSAGGALLEANRPANLQPGDRVYVGIALKRRQAVLAASEMLDAEVVRSFRTTDDRTALAVRFLEAAGAAWVTARRAA